MQRFARIVVASATLLTRLGVVFGLSTAMADSALKIAGFADVPPAGPGGRLALPLASGAPPVTSKVQLGNPAVQMPIQITSSTKIESETGSPVTLTDGDRVKMDAVIVGAVLRATKLKLE